MKASEFITEEKRGKPLDAQAKVSPGAVFTPDGFYDMYRAGVLMGRSPAEMDDIDPYSWITKLPVIVTYTEEEREMIKKTFKKMGIPFKEHIPQGSEEPDAINNASPTQGFKGYPR
jgi:hypothetical protein